MTTQSVELVPQQDYLHFYDAPHTLNLREKYIHGILTNRHALTQTDLQRIIQPESNIKIAPFTQQGIQSALNLNSEESHTVELLLNNGVDDQAIHWLAARFTIDPIAHTVSYTLTDPFNETDTASLQARMSQAIGDNLGWTIEPRITTGVVNPTDRHLTGYYALHALQPLAIPAASNHDALIRAVYTQQLNDLYIPRDIYDVLNANTASQFIPPLVDDGNLVRINEGTLATFLEAIPTQAPERQDTVDDAIVGEFIREYQPDALLMRFPSQGTQTPNAIQYESMFEQFSQIDLISIKPLPRMVLSHTNIQALDGLNAFYANHSTKLFNELQINIQLESSEKAQLFILKLKLALNNLSRASLNKLVIVDERNVLTPELIKDLQTFIQQRQLAVVIDLPQSWQTTSIQRDLDNTIEINQRLHNQAVFAKNGITQSTKPSEPTKKPKRQRERLNLRENVNIDIELQEGVEEDVVVESFTPKNRNPLEQADLTILRLSDLKQAVQTQNFDAFNQTKHGLDDKALVGQWHKVFGNIVNGTLRLGSSEREQMGVQSDDQAETIGRQKIVVNQTLNGITTQAFAKFNEHRDYFIDGINPYDLPSGFLLVTDPSDPNQQVLHYDKNATNQSTLLPNLPSEQVKKPLSMALTQQLLTHESVNPALRATWEQLNIQESYLRDENQAFRCNLPENLKDDATHSLFTLLSPELSAQISAYPLTHTELNELLRIYDQYGVAGIEQIVSIWDTVNAQQFPTIIKHVRQYETMLLNDEALKNAIATIHGLSPEKRQWWDALYDKHEPKDDNLCELVKSFTQFIREIEAKNLAFMPLHPNSKAFSTIHNLPMALSRMLSIVQQCDPRDQALQWQAIPHIDLSAQGALYALSDVHIDGKQCGFVIPEMKIDPTTALTPPAYTSDNDYKKVVTADVAERTKQFYRFIAHQPHRLSLSFYQEAVSILEQARRDKTLPDTVVNQLYAILLDSTTGKNCRYFIKDEALARTQWQTIVTSMQAISLPANTDTAKEMIADELFTLTRLPALPVLTTLVQLITTPLHNVTIFNAAQTKSKMNRLGGSCALLNTLADVYDAKIYVGMKFYSQDDFEQTYPVSSDEASNYPDGRSLFEEHLNVCWQFHRYYQSAPLIPGLLIPLVSTFKFKKQDVQAMVNAVFEQTQLDFNTVLVSYALECLQDVETTQDLTADKLKQFLSKQLSDSLTPISLAFTNRYSFLLSKDERTPNEEEEFKKRHAVIQQMNTISPATRKQLSFTDEHKATIIQYSKALLLDLLEEEFKNNFPPNYFEALKAGKAQGEVAQRVDEVFKTAQLKDTFELIRIAYRQIETNDIITLIDTLDIILQRLDSQSEKLQLLKQLSDPRLLAAPFADYRLLVDSIAKHGSSSFGYFMDVADAQPLDKLTHKANYFISEALPLLRNHPSKQLNEIDAATLAAHLVLAGKNNEINASIALNPALTQRCQNLIANGLNSNNVDSFENELQAIKAIDSTLASNAALQALEAHLAWYKTPETELIEVRTTTQVPVRRPIEPTGIVETAKKKTSEWLKWIGLSSTTPEPDVEAVFETQETIIHERRPIEKILDENIINQALAQIKHLGEQSATYSYAVTQTFDLINQLIAHYPAAKSLLLPLTDKILSADKDESDQHILAIYHDLVLLNQELTALNNQDLVISLCEHFNGKNSAFNFKQLLSLLQNPNYSGLSQNAKNQVLRVVCSLLNNDKPCSFEDITSIIDRCQNNTYVVVLQQVFNTAPYPTLDTLNNWIDNVPKDIVNVRSHVAQQYTTWSKQPVEREEINGFHLKEAKKQAKLMQGVVYSDEELKAIDRAVKEARTLDTQALLQQIKAIEGTGKDNATALVALMAELLYRTKGLPQEVIDDERQWGRSFEINTTQYLAIHSMLKAGGHVTSQIGTGEGKSRIMMLSIACQYALGKTVDFVTADVSLATRDYLEYQAFFKALGAETNLIMANTPASEYRIGGINFSDASNLSLFRNKARSEGLGHLVIASNPKDRALLLDEADKTFFDACDTRFNYSAQANPAIRDMPWMYELMVEFFSIDGNRDLYDGPTSDADTCNQAFNNFARGKLDDAQMNRLNAVSVKQLEAWQSSALTALDLKFQEDFNLRSNVTIVTKQGPKQVSQAKLITGLRASDNAKLSVGVHQCLHARLNQERKQALRSIQARTPFNELTKLQQALVQAHFDKPFFIDSENQIVYSSTSKALIDDYSEGEILAVTGSAGSIKEQEEAQITYGKANEQMTFIDVPRHRGKNRIDLPVVLSKDENHQRKNILSAIRKALERNQPILLVCKNDKESSALYDFLQTSLTEQEQQQLKRISTDTTLDDEAHHIENQAGQPCAITVSTAMLGRGTDIKLHGNAKQYGLNVLCTYLPRERDELQIIGRSGRFGAKGNTQFILNIEGERFDKQTIYTATESYLKAQQVQMDELAQKQRLIKDAVGDFRLALTRDFFNKFYTPVYTQGNQKDDLLRYWQVFIDKTDKAWNVTWPSISNLLAQDNIDRNAINQLLEHYQVTVQEEWQFLREGLQAQIREGKIQCAEGEKTVDTALRDNVSSIKLSEKADTLIYAQARGKQDYKTTIAETYDKAFVGRAVRYTKWIDNIRAFIDNFKSAWRGDTPWFPTYQAVKNGHMTWKEFFFGASTKSVVLTETEIDDISEEHDSSNHINELLVPVQSVKPQKTQDDSNSSISYQQPTQSKKRQTSKDDIELIRLQKEIKGAIPKEENLSNEENDDHAPH